MAEPRKVLYSLDLSMPRFVDVAEPADSNALRSGASNGGAVEIRPVVPSDLDVLAALMLEGYRGTIDYEGEELPEAIEGVEEYFSDAPMLDASAIAIVDGVAASAVLVMSLDGGPFISFVFSHPDYKRTGLAKLVVTRACRVLAASGETSVRFAITEGNTASETLFTGLGAVPEHP